MPVLSNSRLRADSATNVGVLTAIGVYLIYSNALPPAVDVRQGEPYNNDIEVARRHAAWKSAALIGLTFYVARDINSYIISGAALVGIDIMHKHANAVNPRNGKVEIPDDTHLASASTFPLPQYQDNEDAA